MVGDRIAIRTYRPDQARAVWEAIAESRESLAIWMPDIAQRRTVADVRAGLEFLEQARLRADRVLFGIWRRGDDRFLGEVGLHEVNRAAATAVVGYWLRSSARGHGFIDDGLRLLHAYAARELGVRTLQAHVGIENLASRRVAERNGYLLTGERAADPRWDGIARTMLVYTCQFNPDGSH